MKKIYSLVMSALMLLPAVASAQTLTQENEVLTSWEYHLEKDVNFVSGKVNEGMSNEKDISPNDALEIGEADASVKINNYATCRLNNKGLEFMSVSSVGNIDMPAGKGLRSTKNERWIGINDLREGQILVFEVSNQDTTQFVVNSIACNGKTNWEDNLSDPLIVEPISKSVYGLSDLPGGEEGSEEVTEEQPQPYRYFKVINPGTLWIKFNGKTANYLYRMQIWTSNADKEAVSVPTMQMVGVNGEARRIAFTAGESTFGSKCSTYYSFEGEDPIFLKDTEEIDHYEYTYKKDDAGNIILDENNNPIVETETPVYKKVIDEDQVEEAGGYYGDHPYGEDEGYIEVSSSDDEDGDGVVVVKFASVSETGVMSSIESMSVNVGEITLNAPTLTLTGFKDKERAYVIGWTNNTLCGEEYSMTVETGEGAFLELNPNEGVGTEVTSAKSVKVTVAVPGYGDGVCELAEVDAYDMVVSKRTDLGNGMSEDHNWDFAVLSDDALKQINGEVYEKYVVKDEETGAVLREYTVEQVENEEVPEDDVDKIEPVVKYFGWDGADSRNANRHWRTHVPTYEVDGDGNPTETVASVAYAADETGLLNGIIADNSHPSYSTMAIFTDGAGLYYMSRGTIEIADVKYGEYVVLTTGDGTTVTKFDFAGPMLLNIAPGVYVKSIDVCTYAELPDVPDSIDEVETSSADDASIYTVNGVKVSSLQKGINIVRTANGVKKIMVK